MIHKTTTTTIGTRKRSRTMSKQSATIPLSFLTLAVLLIASQASALSAASSLASETANLPSASQDLNKIDHFELYNEDEIVEWDDENDYNEEDEIGEWDDDEDEGEYEYEYEEEEEEYEDEEEDEEEQLNEEEEYDEDYEEEEYQDDEVEHEWTPQDLDQMDRLYDAYVQEIVNRFGVNWEEEYELLVDKEEIYVAWLNYEEEKKQREVEQRVADELREQETEELRQVTLVSHKALLQQDALALTIETNNAKSQNQTQMQATIDSLGDAMVSSLPSRSHMIVINTGVSFNKYKTKKNSAEESTASIVTGEGGNTQSLIGSI